MNKENHEESEKNEKKSTLTMLPCSFLSEVPEI